jgi:hypothetical protein
MPKVIEIVINISNLLYNINKEKNIAKGATKIAMI